MTSFFVEPGEPVAGTLSYRARAQSFDFVPADPDVAAAAESGLELMFGNISLTLDRISGRLIQIWGYHPDARWHRTPLAVPDASPGTVRGELPTPLPPVGVAERLSSIGDQTTSHDPASGWIHISAGAAGDRLVTFATGCVAEFDGRRLVGLWLKPKMD